MILRMSEYSALQPIEDNRLIGASGFMICTVCSGWVGFALFHPEIHVCVHDTIVIYGCRIIEVMDGKENN